MYQTAAAALLQLEQEGAKCRLRLLIGTFPTAKAMNMTQVHTWYIGVVTAEIIRLLLPDYNG